MDVTYFICSNIPLFCMTIAMYFISIRNLAIKRRESIYFIVFTTIVLSLVAVVGTEKFTQANGYREWGTIATSFGYILRPCLLYIFLLLALINVDVKKSFYLLWLIPLGINTIIFIIPWFFNSPTLSKLVFYYELNADGTASFMRGGFLNFTSHLVCVVYILLLIYVSIMRLYGKHRQDAIVLMLCALFIVGTVIVETFTGRSDLLNTVCETCAMINYIFIESINASKDTLTNLYDRKTFYEDVTRYGGEVNGIIQMDMNELKFLNDNFGHTSGDEALKCISNVFEGAINKKNMFVYRLSGDEFVVLMMDGKKEQLLNTIETIKANLVKTDYTVSIGYYYIDKNDTISFDDALKAAESAMYQDKSRYYVETGHDRRIR